MADKLKPEIVTNRRQRIGLIERIEMQPAHAVLDQTLALPRGIFNSQLNRRSVVGFDFNQLLLQLGGNLGTAERSKAAHLWRGKNRQYPRNNRHVHAELTEVVGESEKIVVIEK